MTVFQLWEAHVDMTRSVKWSYPQTVHDSRLCYSHVAKFLCTLDALNNQLCSILHYLVVQFLSTT